MCSEKTPVKVRTVGTWKALGSGVEGEMRVRPRSGLETGGNEDLIQNNYPCHLYYSEWLEAFHVFPAKKQTNKQKHKQPTKTNQDSLKNKLNRLSRDSLSFNFER